jgi:pimeloyl-ACP methyl ester carboxylesterase
MDYFLMSEDVEELMEDLGLKKAAVLGHSMGGKAAMLMALTKVGKLIRSDSSEVAYKVNVFFFFSLILFQNLLFVISPRMLPRRLESVVSLSSSVLCRV